MRRAKPLPVCLNDGQPIRGVVTFLDSRGKMAEPGMLAPRLLKAATDEMQHYVSVRPVTEQIATNET